jgi:multimeric flavodoxin WrbA
MKAAVFYGTAHKGNTSRAAGIFMDELSKRGDASFAEFYMPAALPGFCTGCALCQGGLREKCPEARYVDPILEAILGADALIFATPHYGACGMPASMKNLFDHLDFLVMNVSPEAGIFDKKAFILTTGAGSTAAIRPISNVLKHWGVNRVRSYRIRMFTNTWDGMPAARRRRCENKLRASARKFYRAKKGRPHILTVIFYYMSKFIIKKYVGEGNFTYEYWKDKGYFTKRPF